MNHFGVSVKELLALLRENPTFPLDGTSTTRHLVGDFSHPDAILGMLHLTFMRLGESDLFALDLFKVMACFDRQGLTKRLFERLPAVSRRALNEAFGLLQGLSLITWNRRKSSFFMQPIVRLAIRREVMLARLPESGSDQAAFGINTELNFITEAERIICLATQTLLSAWPSGETLAAHRDRLQYYHHVLGLLHRPLDTGTEKTMQRQAT